MPARHGQCVADNQHRSRQGQYRSGGGQARQDVSVAVLVKELAIRIVRVSRKQALQQVGRLARLLRGALGHTDPGGMGCIAVHHAVPQTQALCPQQRQHQQAHHGVAAQGPVRVAGGEAKAGHEGRV